MPRVYLRLSACVIILLSALTLTLLSQTTERPPIRVGDPATEWKRSKPDVVVYLPKGGDRNDGDNEHFLVFESPKGELLAMWTQSSVEGFGDNHILLARSKDGVKWSEPIKIAGPSKGEKIPQAGWGFPVVSKKGRIYCFYSQDSPSPQRDERGRTLKTNEMGVAFSDDDGHTWQRGADLPWPKGDYDHPDGLSAYWNWIVWQNPIRDSRGRWLVGYSYTVSPKLRKDNPPGYWVGDSGTKFMRFENIDEAPDPKDIKIKHLMFEGKGLTIKSGFNPELSDAEEPSLVLLPDKRLFTTLRTSTGYIWYSVSSDDGETWRQPEVLRYKDGGEAIPQPKAPCPIYPLGPGRNGRYLLVYHNNPGKLGDYSQYAPPATWRAVNQWSHVRRPAFIALGEYRPRAHQPIWFSPPKQILDTDGVIVGPKKTAEIATYTSFTERRGRRVLWYPDRKYYLLGKYITDELLEGMKAPR